MPVARVGWVEEFEMLPVEGTLTEMCIGINANYGVVQSKRKGSCSKVAGGVQRW